MSKYTVKLHIEVGESSTNVDLDFGEKGVPTQAVLVGAASLLNSVRDKAAISHEEMMLLVDQLLKPEALADETKNTENKES